MAIEKEMDKFLEELIFAEDKIITYKYLAINKSIPFNQAKKYLNDFVSSHENVSASYSVVGYKAGGMVVKVVSSEHKEDAIKQFNDDGENDDEDDDGKDKNNDNSNKVRVDIYSAQSKPLQDVHLLYTLDYELCKRLGYEHKSMYAIRNDEVVVKKGGKENGRGDGVRSNGGVRVGSEGGQNNGVKSGGIKVKDEGGNENYNRLVGEKLAVKSEIKSEKVDKIDAVDKNKIGNNSNDNDNKKEVEVRNTKALKGSDKGSKKLENLFNNHKKTAPKKEVKEDVLKNNGAKDKTKKNGKNTKNGKQKNTNTSHRRKVLVKSSSEEEEIKMDVGYDDDVQFFSEDEFKSPKKKVMQESDSEEENIKNKKNKNINNKNNKKDDTDSDKAATLNPPKSSNSTTKNPPKSSLKTTNTSPIFPAVMKKRVMERNTYQDEDGFMVTERVVQSIEVEEKGKAGGGDDEGCDAGGSGANGEKDGDGSGKDDSNDGDMEDNNDNNDVDNDNKKIVDDSINKKDSKEKKNNNEDNNKNNKEGGDKKKNNKKNKKNEKSNVKQASMMSFFSKK